MLLDRMDIPDSPGRTLLSGAPEGFDACVLASMAQNGPGVLFIARDDRRMATVIDSLRFFAPATEIISFPAWDCLPYDRVSPRPDILAARVNALTELSGGDAAGPRVVVTTIAAVLQRVPVPALFMGSSLTVRPGPDAGRSAILDFLAANGFGRAEVVMEPGEYAVRGGIVDLFPPGAAAPLRLDFFDEELESIRTFEPFSQRTVEKVGSFEVKPVSELQLTGESVVAFRTGYRELFGAPAKNDHLYESISAGRRQAGMEHWLPLFTGELTSFMAYAEDIPVILDHQSGEAAEARWELISECHAARVEIQGGGIAGEETVYNPLPPGRLYVPPDEWRAALEGRVALQLTPFAAPEGSESTLDAGGRPGRDFADARARTDVNVFDVVRDHLAELRRGGRRVLIGCVSEGSRERIAGILAEHGIDSRPAGENWSPDQGLEASAIATAVLDLARGFTAPGIALVSEQDILGERLRVRARRRIRPENFIAETSALAAGDLVVHLEHGLGRYRELTALDVAGAPHDCLRVDYDGGDKLFVPVENIDVLSRYGDESSGVRLDRLGGAGWQARKAQLKKRIREMADQLIQVAASRELRPAEVMAPQDGAYDEFCAGFPYEETEDQLQAIADVIDDLAAGKPMDRLICGDVGFGKTEVALRAAFVAALSGRQVAVVVPTTLLARQHYQVFAQRFAHFPIRVAQLSRLVGAGEAEDVRMGLADGTLDIVIGTHALLAKSIRIERLGLLVIDEEQHFGVAHKERLKALRTDVHVLTLTATPIPRTLQMALTGIREMSLITTPPVDRLAVRTFVLPFDPMVIREAIQRERYRGGQLFFVCPRVADLARVAETLEELVPEARIAVAHGRMAASRLEEVMTEFYDGGYDVLLSTNIVESGLDLPAANTIVIHRADMFGLAQLYQLRGRVGRSKVRAYAYLTLPPNQLLAATAERRLEVMQTLDSLGAGFMLASHDLDIRGAGNLLGEEQSGHIREVGIELYQQMLEEAVAEAKADAGGAVESADHWSPQIDAGIPVLIPADYVPDLGVRLSLYRRLGNVRAADEIEAIAAEMIDRFGSLPDEVENLLQVVALKSVCRSAGVEKIEAGPKGAVVSFRKNEFANPAGLVEFITAQAGTAKLRPDHSLVFMRRWETAPERFDGVRYLARELSTIAAAA